MGLAAHSSNPEMVSFCPSAPVLGAEVSPTVQLLLDGLDPTPAFAFGHGLGYGHSVWSDASATAREIPVDGSVTVSIDIGNASDRDGVEVVQLYMHDPVASVVRPVQRLIGYARVALVVGERVRVSFEVPTDLTSFTGADGRRRVEPGEIVLGFGRSSADIVQECRVRITGTPRQVDHTRALHAAVGVEHLG